MGVVLDIFLLHPIFMDQASPRGCLNAILSSSGDDAFERRFRPKVRGITANALWWAPLNEQDQSDAANYQSRIKKTTIPIPCGKGCANAKVGSTPKGRFIDLWY